MKNRSKQARPRILYHHLCYIIHLIFAKAGGMSSRYINQPARNNATSQQQPPAAPLGPEVTILQQVLDKYLIPAGAKQTDVDWDSVAESPAWVFEEDVRAQCAAKNLVLLVMPARKDGKKVGVWGTVPSYEHNQSITTLTLIIDKDRGTISSGKIMRIR
jgi:hypothetical protein